MLATIAWTASGVILYLLAPMAAPALVLLGVVAPIGWLVAAKGSLPLQKPSAASFALVLAGAYLTVNASWSLSPGEAHVSLIMFFLQILALHLVYCGLAGSDGDVLRAILIGLAIGAALSSVVLCFDVLSMQLPRRLLASMVPALRPSPRDMLFENGRVIFLQPFLLNRSMAALIFLFWPAMLAIALVTPRGWWRHAWLVALVAAVAAISGSEHAASQVALAGSVVVFAVCTVLPVLTRRAIIGCWVAVVILVVPLASVAYQNQLYLSPWLARSAQHRIVIWGHTSQLIGNAPILGAGINTARALNDPHRLDAPLAPGSDLRLTTSLHSHNVYLQTWYEAGAVGAALLMILGLAVIGAIGRAPRYVQPYLYAAFAACALLGSSSFSFWQPWFMASFGLAAGFAMTGIELAARSVSASGDAPPSSPAA